LSGLGRLARFTASVANAALLWLCAQLILKTLRTAKRVIADSDVLVIVFDLVDVCMRFSLSVFVNSF
jgi:hypothetical protein